MAIVPQILADSRTSGPPATLSKAVNRSRDTSSTQLSRIDVILMYEQLRCHVKCQNSGKTIHASHRLEGMKTVNQGTSRRRSSQNEKRCDQDRYSRHPTRLTGHSCHDLTCIAYIQTHSSHDHGSVNSRALVSSKWID